MSSDANPPPPRPTPIALVLAAWMFVGVPLVWGILQTMKKAAALFQ
jgi:hypothetical protein